MTDESTLVHEINGVLDSIGVHPMGSSKVTTESCKDTDCYKRGWNDCGHEISKDIIDALER